MIDYEVTDRTDGEVFLRLRGELVGEVTSEQLKADLERHYVDDGVKVIAVDLSGLDLISLEGIVVLVELWEESKARGKQFRVDGPQGQVMDKLRVTGLLNAFD